MPFPSPSAFQLFRFKTETLEAQVPLFGFVKNPNAGIVKANLGSFLSLVMVTFDIGSESCQDFLEILHGTNRFVNRSHATVSLQFSIQECGNCGRQFLRSSSELQDEIAIQINAYNMCCIWLIWHLNLDTLTVPSFDQYTLATLGTFYFRIVIVDHMHRYMIITCHVHSQTVSTTHVV